MVEKGMYGKNKTQESFDKKIVLMKSLETLGHCLVFCARYFDMVQHQKYTHTHTPSFSVLSASAFACKWEQMKREERKTHNSQPMCSTHRWIRITLSLRINYAWTNSNLINECYGLFFSVTRSHSHSIYLSFQFFFSCSGISEQWHHTTSDFD